MEINKTIINQELRQDLPDMRIGDTINVHTKIVEGESRRTQVFAGTLIARKGSSISETITVRKVSFGEGVEKIFPIQSPCVEKIEVSREGYVRRAKLYHLREKVGKQTSIKARKRTVKARKQKAD